LYIKEAIIFTKKEIPEEAKPVHFAQLLLAFVLLALVGLSFVNQDFFLYLYHVVLPFLAYYGFTIYKTGYVIWTQQIYNRKENPFIFMVSLFTVIASCIFMLSTFL